MIKVILLDLGGVVFESRGSSTGQIDWKIVQELNEKYSPNLELGDTTINQFIEDYNNRTNQKLTIQEFLSAIHDTIGFNKKLIDYLSERYEIVVVSDNYKENIEALTKRYHFAKWASQQHYSYQYGLKKSNPELFRKVFDTVSKEPEECLLIDDDPQNVKIAKQFGAKGVVFKNTEQTIEEMKNLEDGQVNKCKQSK